MLAGGTAAPLFHTRKFKAHSENSAVNFFLAVNKAGAPGSSPAAQAGARYTNASQQQRSTPCCGPKTEACMFFPAEQRPCRLLGVLCSCWRPGFLTSRQNPSNCLHSTSHSNARKSRCCDVRCAMLKHTLPATANTPLPCTHIMLCVLVVQGGSRLHKPKANASLLYEAYGLNHTTLQHEKGYQHSQIDSRSRTPQALMCCVLCC